MKIKSGIAAFLVAGVVSFTFYAEPAFSQKKPTQSKPGTSKPAAKKPSSQTKQNTSASASIPPEKMDVYKEQAAQLVSFYASTLNFLGDKKNTVKDKEVIINESYLKVFWDSEVQVEDDLDPKRLVPLYKDVQAYLTDVDFFFKSVKFTYQLQDVAVMTNDRQQTFFLVTANRNIAGITVDGDSVNNNLVRYFEMNYDETKQELKIVSIYTTKLNEKSDLRNWWNGLTDSWRMIFGKDLLVNQDLPLSRVSAFYDTTAVVDGVTIPITDSRIYGLILRIIDSRELDLSGQKEISDLQPLSKLSALTTLDISNTGVSDLMPLRNLNALQVFRCSGTAITTLEPLRYCTHIRELDISKTGITDLSVVSYFPALESLDVSGTQVSSLNTVKDLVTLKNLRAGETRVSSLDSLGALVNLETLDFSGTSVTRIDVLKNYKALQKVWFDHTAVNTLAPLADLTMLKAVYCNDTKVSKAEAVAYMQSHPGEIVIFASGDLGQWWKGMGPEWRKVFGLMATLDAEPTTEQLHLLLTIDSINITGRTAITSLDPLKELTELKKLYCAHTSVSSFEPLAELVNITYIDANSTKVSELGSLSKLKELKTLLVDNTTVNDLAPVSGLPALTLVQADNTGVNTKNANAFLDENPDVLVVYQTYENTAWWNNLSDAWKKAVLKQMGLEKEPDKFQLQQIANLEELTVEQDPQIMTLSPVLYMKRLKTLRFSDTQVTTLEPLGQMGWLKSLSFPKNPILSLEPISGLTGLTELNFENTQVEDMQPIMNLVNLEVLKISGSQVKNLKYISMMKKLQVIEFYNTRIGNIDPLDFLPDLKSVKMFNTKVSAKKVDRFKSMHPGCEVVFY